MSIEVYSTKRTKKSLTEVSRRIYECSRLFHTAVDSMPLFANVFANKCKACFSHLRCPSVVLVARECVVIEDRDATCGQI